MRVRFLGLALLSVATIACDGGSSATDATDITGPSGNGNNSAERLGVPEEYKLLWNTTEGCENSNGPGTQVYWHTDDAKSSESGGITRLTFTETWYWFHGGNGAADCKDTWQVTAEFVTTDYAQLGCVGCEEAYYFRRTLQDQGCQYQYHQLFGYDEDDQPPAEPEFLGYMMFDTHNEFNDSPNEDNKMLVVARYKGPSGWSLNNNYGTPAMSRRIVDDPERIGPPGEYTWVGESCVGSSGGGGA